MTSLVLVDNDALDAYVDTLITTGLTAADWRLPVYPDDDLEFVAHIGVQNALNFCFFNPAADGK
ncbi:hypothetical protein DVS28_a2937 [Euzebya pacifica]|uniref:Uncharacterized protein n=1 Tax=Euzebya pacifica TaxID=1608957 RepID=A0A346XZG9_9ACTN|nr:hypothetical protein [Euzebya pacifica]AXV07616.1 hypothetical protein DVS28_a2937 [Euzebya pacifica]